MRRRLLIAVPLLLAIALPAGAATVAQAASPWRSCAVPKMPIWKVTDLRVQGIGCKTAGDLLRKRIFYGKVSGYRCTPSHKGPVLTQVCTRKGTSGRKRFTGTYERKSG